MGPNSIINHFENLSDPREDNKRYNLIDIIVITICADKWEEIKAYGIAKEKGYRRFFELPHRIPSHDTIRRVFASLNPEEFNRCFIDWIETWRSSPGQDIINIDGKTVKIVVCAYGIQG